MRTSFGKNGLAVGVILLFIGVTVQPAIAVNPISSDNEENCNICPKISKLQLVEKYQELSDSITTFTEMNKKINPVTTREDNQTICKILWIVLGVFVGPLIILDKILTSFEGTKLWNILEPIFYLFITLLTVLSDIITDKIYKFDCV